MTPDSRRIHLPPRRWGAALFLALGACEGSTASLAPDASDDLGAPPDAQTAPDRPTATDAQALDATPLADRALDDSAAPADVSVDLDASTPRDAQTDDAAPPGERGSVRVEPGATDDAELIRRLPIGTNADNAPRRVVLRLGPDALPSLRADDVLMTPAEVEVTTACDIGQSGPACGYNPTVAAQIILTGDPDDTDPSGAESRALSEVVRTSVTSAEHHYTFSFRANAARATLAGGFALPCVASGRCSVNLVMWAWDGSARPGGADVLLVGENEGDFLANGMIQGDKARLMAIRERAITRDDRTERETAGGSAVTMPLDASGVLIYSHPLAGTDGSIAAGEQFYVEARVTAETSGRARFSTLMFVTRDPRATEPTAFEGVFPRSISEHNGSNCTPGTSPCTSHRVAVFRATESLRGPVYVHLIARSAVPGGGSATVTVQRRDGWLRSTRYAASLY